MAIVSSTDGSPTKHLLEAPLQRGVLLDPLAVLVQRGRADHPQLAAGQHRLEHVAGVHRRPRPRPRPTTVCSSSMKVMIWPSLALISSSTALRRSSNSPRYFAPGHHRAQVERDQPLAAQRLGHVAGHDPLGQALDDRGLADPGLADQDRVVLGPAGQHLDRPGGSRRPGRSPGRACRRGRAAVRSTPYFSSAW